MPSLPHLALPSLLLCGISCGSSDESVQSSTSAQPQPTASGTSIEPATPTTETESSGPMVVKPSPSDRWGEDGDTTDWFVWNSASVQVPVPGNIPSWNTQVFFGLSSES